MRTFRRILWAGLALSACGLIGLGSLWVMRLGRREPVRPAPAASSTSVVSLDALHAARARDGMRATPIGDSALQEEPAPAWRLLGTWVADFSPASLALVEDRSLNKRAFARVNDRFGSWQLSAIERGRITLTNPSGQTVSFEMDAAAIAAGGVEEPVPMFYSAIDEVQDALDRTPDPSDPMAQQAAQRAATAVVVVSEQERVVDRDRLHQALQGSLLPLLAQGRVIPHLEGMKFNGLRVTWLADSPWTQTVGLRVGDVVTAVNGKPLLDPRQMAEIVRDFHEAPTVELTVQRGGRAVSLRYEMVSAAARTLDTQ